MSTKKYPKFLECHEPQLVKMNLPKSLYKQLYKKLKHGNYDSGEYLQILRNENDSRYQSMARIAIEAESKVFLIDQAWTFQEQAIYESLNINDKLRKRMMKMLEFASNKITIPGTKPPRPELLDLITNIKVRLHVNYRT